MTTTNTPATSLHNVLAWTGGIAVIWIVVAIARPETTLHLGPVLLPLLPAYLLRGQQSGLRGLGAGTIMASGVIVLLSTTGNLDGPSFKPFDSAVAESLVFLGFAVSFGLAILKWPAAER